MKNVQNKINGCKLLRGVSFSVDYALKISIPVMLILLIVLIFRESFPSPMISLLPLFLMWMMSVAIVTFFISVFIGIPITIILIKLGLDDEWISAFFGAFIVFYMILVSVGFTSSALMYTFYGFGCAYGFMKGYKKS